MVESTRLCHLAKLLDLLHSKSLYLRRADGSPTAWRGPSFQPSADASAALAAFRSEVVDKLLAAGAHPLDRSKTELGAECK